MNKIWAVSMVKDEADIIYHTLMHLASEGMDGILISDNLSTDNTLNEIERAKQDLAESNCKIVILQDGEVGYYQSKKMTNLANKAHHEYGADWIVPFDADEIWYSPNMRLSDRINSYHDFVTVLNADIYNHYGTAADPSGDNPFKIIGWRKRQKGDLPKVSFRWADGIIIDQGNHGVMHPNYFVESGLEIRHFPYRSRKQIISKALNGYDAYAATNLPYHTGSHWRQYGKLIHDFGEEKFLAEVYEKYFWFYSPLDNGMVFEPAPFRKWDNIK